MARKALRRIFGRVGDSRGATIIEAAIITPLLLMLTIGIMEFASLFYVYLALENGVSQATRFAVTGRLMSDPLNPGSNLSRIDSMKAAMRAATPTITIPDSEFSFSNMAPGATVFSPGVGGPGAIEKITVTHTWTMFTPLFRPFFTNGQIVMQVDSSMQNERF
jgi:TadE-like protein